MKTHINNIVKIILIISVIFGPCAFAHAQEGQDINSFEEGLKLYYQKRFSESREFFYEAVSKDPNNTMAMSFYLDASYHCNDLIKTVNALERKSVEGGNTPILKAYVGLAYFTRGLIDRDMLEEARLQFVDALGKDSSLPIANCGMGMLYYQKRLMPRAKGYFLKALSGNPKDLMAMELLGEIIMNEEKDPATALEYFKTIIQAEPLYSDGYFYMGSALEKLGKREEAINFYQKCLEIDRNGILKGYDAPTRIGDIYLKDSNWAEAEKYYKVSLEINPDNAYARTQLEKARNRGKGWQGEKYDPLKDKLQK